MGLIQSNEAFRAKTGYPGKKEFYLKIVREILPANFMNFGLASHHNHMNQFLKINLSLSTHTHTKHTLIDSVSLENPTYRGIYETKI